MSAAKQTTALTKKGMDFQSQVGMVVSDNSGNSCLAINNEKLDTGSRLTLVVISRSRSGMPQSIGEAEVLRRGADACSEKIDSRIDQSDPGLTRYKIRMLKGSLLPGSRAIAV